MTTASLVSATGALVLTSSPASAATVWCGSWLQYPSKASQYAVVQGTEATIGTYQGKRHYMRVLAGLYNGEWYAFAKEYNAGVADFLAMIWVNRGNNGIYQCGGSDGGPKVYPGSWPSEAYTAGVDYPHAMKVQAKIDTSSPIYGPVAYT
ncbi:hypothetical protein [Actinomadura macrotermitis]|uniref:hypothetical protein n=1 Tax=Actinomadura macrotermitis TaxID=2585200 RepID=UPI001296F698|nr:hypothetical protein [Actinomadura macrotermitis]